jgi:hypothetical protein
MESLKIMGFSKLARAMQYLGHATNEGGKNIRNPNQGDLK